MTATLVDEEARRIAISDLDTCLLVEAGAGTGKTTLIVERVLHILTSGAARIDAVLAITFTEKAAAELRARLRARIDAAARVALGEERARLRDALDRFDLAQIGTIHALAGALLRERPVEAALDPAFEVMDDLAATQAFDEAYMAWLDVELAGSPAAARVALNLGLDLKYVREAAALLQRERDLLPEHWHAPRPEACDALLGWLGEQVAALGRLLPHCHAPTDNGVKIIREQQRWLEIAGRASAEAFERLLAQWRPTRPLGDQRNWRPRESCAEQKAIIQAINERLSEARTALGQAAITGLLGWLAGFVRGYERERRRGGRAEFQDLLVWARDLLRDSRAARAYYQHRFAYVLVDEFQDTDPLQVEIVFFLSEDGADAARWTEVKLKPGKLLIVGDPKQAIYRFRRAEIGTYKAAQCALEASGGRALAISQNFRSVKGVVDWVNRTFVEVIGREYTPHQAAYAEIVASLPPCPDWPVPPVVVLHPEESERTLSANARRRAEAGALARLVRRVVEEEAWPLLEREAAAVYGTRRPRYRDIALLFGAMTELELFEDALRGEGVPYRVEGGRLFYERREVRDLTNALATLDDPTDQVALIATLKSAPFAFADEELFMFADAGNALDYLTDPGEGWPRFQAAFALLARLHEQRLRLPPAVLVETVIAETRLAELALLSAGGDQAASNLFKVVEQARDLAGRPGATFRGFVRWLRENQRRPPRESDSVAGESGDDTVRLMTVHQAKGLEFPVVLLANARGREHREACIVDRAEGRIEMRLGDQSSIFRTPRYNEAAEAEKLHAEAELRRLFYVACTRARDHLVVPLFAAEQGYAALLGGNVPLPGAVAPGEQAAGVLVYDCGPLWRETPDPPPLRLEVRDGPLAAVALAEREAWSARRARRLPLPEIEADELGWEDSPRSDEATLLRAVRATLEQLHLARPHDLAALAADAALAEGVAGSAAEVERRVRLCLACVPVQAAARATRVIRGRALSSGIVDLTFAAPRGLVLICYQDAGEPIEGAAVRARKLAAELLALGQAVGELWVLNLMSGDAVAAPTPSPSPSLR